MQDNVRKRHVYYGRTEPLNSRRAALPVISARVPAAGEAAASSCSSGDVVPSLAPRLSSAALASEIAPSLRQ